MKVVIYILLFFVFSTPVKAGAFSEIFGSEGAAGIANEKTRNLSWTIHEIKSEEKRFCCFLSK